MAPRAALLPAPDAEQHLLAAALEAQKAGRLSEARELYQRVVASQPDNFDARHMLGVVHYQRGELELAREHVALAIRMRPFERAALKNLFLIDKALERRPVEEDISREVLPRLAPRCVAPSSPDEHERWQDADLDIVVLKAGIDTSSPELERLARWFRPRTLTLWLESGMPKQAQSTLATRIIEPTVDALPRANRVVFFGADRSPGDWFQSMNAGNTGLYCSDEPHSLLLDRIPELAREGRAPLRLFFSSATQARRIGLPGTIVGDEARSVCMPSLRIR